jgi:hypothetical protein
MEAQTTETTGHIAPIMKTPARLHVYNARGPRDTAYIVADRAGYMVEAGGVWKTREEAQAEAERWPGAKVIYLMPVPEAPPDEQRIY